MDPFDVRLNVPAQSAYQPVLANAASQYGNRRGCEADQVGAFVELVTLASGAMCAGASPTMELRIEANAELLQAIVVGSAAPTDLGPIQTQAAQLFETRAALIAKDFAIDPAALTIRFTVDHG